MNVALVVLVVALSPVAQDTRAAPHPQDCLKRGQEYARQRGKELGTLTADLRKQIEAERVKLVTDCASGFDVERVPPDQLAALVDLYTLIQQPALAERATARGLALSEPGPRADVLLATIRATLRQPKSAERNAQLERYVDALDAMPDDVLRQKIGAHAALNSYYRADDIDAGIVKHSTWLIDAAKRLAPEARKQQGYTLVAAYVNMAEALAGQGENEKALDLLRRAKTELADLPDVGTRVDPVLARYVLVGTEAPVISAPDWINRDPAAGPLDLKGKVTLLQFTAHWCGPCKESYPGTARLRERFKNQPFQVVFHTRTYGYFGTERNLTREAEIERDRTYFAGYGFDTLPIAVGRATGSDGGDDPLEAAFRVGGIPQINVIDAKGNIRLIMIGYDEANEEKLAAFVEKVLAEK